MNQAELKKAIEVGRRRLTKEINDGLYFICDCCGKLKPTKEEIICNTCEDCL